MLFDAFFRKYGVRKGAQLQTPPMTPLAQITLPQLSIFHYISQSAVDQFPANDELLFRQYTSAIVLENVEMLTTLVGSPKHVGPTANQLSRKFFSTARRYRQLKHLSAFENARNTLVVVNYGLLNAVYRYQRQVFSAYNRWVNIQNTVWSKIAEMTRASRREHFLLIKLPRTLPSLNQLNLAEEHGINQSLLHIFNEPEMFFLVEIWKWLGVHRERSILSQVPSDKHHLVNFIFEDAGRFTTVNLGVIDSWRISPQAEVAADAQANMKGIDTVQLQKRFLHFCMSLTEVASVAGDAPEADAEVVDRDGNDTDATVTSLADGLEHTRAPLQDAKLDTGDGSDEQVNPPDELDQTSNHSLVLDPRMIAKIDADLAQLDKIALRVAALKAQEAKAVQTFDSVHELHVAPLGEDPPEHQAPQVEEPLADTQAPAPNSLQALLPGRLLEQESAPLENDYALGIRQHVDRLTSAGVMSAGEARRYLAQGEKYKTLKAPDGATLEQFSVIHRETLTLTHSPKLPEIATVPDKSMLSSSLLSFHERYVEHVLPKDVCNMVLNLQNAGICITDYEVEREESILGATDNYQIRVNPIEGAPSTFRFKLPVVSDEGTFKANGVTYGLRLQRGDLPIRKTAPDRVALTSYYGKVAVSRSDKKVNDYGHWLRNQIMVKGLDVDDLAIFDLHPNVVFDPSFAAPKLYSQIAMGFSQFAITCQVPVEGHGKVRLHLNFDCHKRKSLYDAAVLAHFEQQGAVVCGTTEDATRYVVMDADSQLHLVGTNHTIPLARFDQLIALDPAKAPVEFTVIRVMGRMIPLGLVLAYYLGLDNLVSLLKARYRRVSAGKRLNLAPNEYVLRFEDESLVLNREDRLATLILAGFNEYANSIRYYSVYDFNRTGVYLNILEAQGASTKYLREMDLLRQLFIDPITKELLVEMHEPTDFQGLLLRANEMLLTETHPSELDPAYMRIKGYERMAGAVYGEIVQAIRAHNGRPGKSKYPIDLHPYAIWKNIAEDPSKAMVVDTNPVQNLKEKEAVTYAGNGGRNSRTMVKHTRAYHDNDMGTISESTVDSGDVGINIYTSADPQFSSLRGISKPEYTKGANRGNASLISTSALNAVGADRDDMKRVNFISIQNSHGLACSGYHVNPVRTGYEQVVAHRTGALYATTAKEAGTVVSVNAHGLVVQYASGKKKAIPLGRQYGSAAGLTIPHEVVAAAGMAVGHAFAAGDILSYNPGFFAPDPLNPKQVAMKAGVTLKVAIMENPMTLEDSCIISRRAANLLKTNITKVRTIVVDFKQSVSRLVAVGTELQSEDILCVIEDAVSANSALFDNASLDTLRVLSAQTPVAKSHGVVERIEVYYHGEKEDMSESLQKLATLGDKDLAQRHRALGEKVRTGQVDEGFRNDGNPLLLDTLAIRLYISTAVEAGVGDKGVFANQLKTVFGEVTDEVITSESGQVVDAIFGGVSIDARIVSSPDIIGTTATLLRVAAARAVKAYKS